MMITTSLVCILILTIQQVKLETTEEEEDLGFDEGNWFEQYLDHLNVWDSRTFPVRYFENSKFFREGGPLLLEIGAEETVDAESIRWSPSYSLAKKLGGKIVLLEHRYYGESFPFDSYDNMTVDDYQYLSVEQVLEDLAFFVESYKNHNPSLQQSKVVVFGCSYGATLATWFRYKFPHLVDAAWASSGPINVTIDFKEYYETAADMYRNVSEECVATVRQSYIELKQLLLTKEGLNEAQRMFQDWECGYTKNMTEDVILALIRLVLSNQYNSPDYGVQACQLLQSKIETLTRLQKMAAFVVNRSKEVCSDDDENDDMSWLYQTCTQFGYSFTTYSFRQPFRDSFSAIESDIESCQDSFETSYSKTVRQRGVDRMNRVYGGIHLKASKILTVHGAHDPWHKVGLYKNSNPELPVLLIPDASHCADVNENKHGNPMITEAREIGMETIDKWLRN